MNRGTSTRSMVEAGLLTAINVVLILISFYVPVVYFVGLFLWPIPIALTHLRHGIKYSVLSIISTGVLVAFLIDPITAISFAIVYGVLGLAMGYSIKNRKSISFTFMLMTLCVFLSTAVMVRLSSLIIGQDVLKEAIDMIQESTKMAKEMYTAIGVPEEQINLVLDKMIPSPDYIKLMLPGAMLMYSVITALVSYLFAYKIFNRFGYKLEKIRPLSEWYVTRKFATAILVIVLISFILVTMNVNNAMMYYINAQMIFATVFNINGIAAVDYYLIKKQVKGALRFIIILFIATSPLGNLFVILGILDYVFNYRKLDDTRIIIK
ncbi:MAG: YybS family protein [Clostridiales bacterium]|nr:YybS family protein [Clostridiales bacterium]